MLKKAIIALFYHCSLLLMISVALPVKGFAQNSILATGTWYKMAVDKDGVYRIDQSLFRKMGFNTGQVDPRKIKIYTQGAGMLPQKNSDARPADLLECAIFIQGEADGVFNSSDFILFFGQGPDNVSFDESRQVFKYEKNRYAKENYYFITVGDTPGKRISISENLSGNYPVVQEFDNYLYHEIDQYNILKSGREWFGERFELTTDQIIRFNLSNIMDNTPIKVISDVMAQSFSNTSFNVFLNNIQIGQHTIASIPNAQYGVKGRHAVDTFLTTSSLVSAVGSNTQELRYQYVKGTAANAVGYLDYCLLQVKQQLRLYGTQTIFRSAASLLQPVSKFEINQTNPQVLVWDITNPLEARIQISSFSGSATSFATPTASLKQFIAFLPSAPAPKLISPVPNQNLRGSSSPDLLIVTHPDFKSEALRLKAHRESFNNLTVLVLTTVEVFNEFSGGKQDVTAIRDLAKHFYDKTPGKLKSLLLFGKGSYDYKDILVDNKNFVPTYQSVNSLHPLLTYSSDDFFGFMEDHEGEWRESPVDQHTMEIGVGRIPVKSFTEAKNVVDKIIGCDTDSKLFHRWRKNIVFVADDGDFNIHQNQADQMARNIDLNHALYDIKKIYLDAFPQLPGAGGQVSPEAKKEIEKAFSDGALVINYTGHGSERQWAQERIFDEVQIQNLKNERLPLLVTATCEFGRQDDPVFPSGGELCLLQPKGGAIGLVTTARPVSSSTNFELNQAFYQAFFEKDNGNNLSLGEIFRRTKNNSISGVSNRNFSLIGDPSLYLAMPEYDIQVNNIETSDNSDLLKALSRVTVKGEIVNAGSERIASFNGTLHSTLFDKETSFITLGNENPPFAYTQWYNALFRGKASVTQGAFEFEFMVPKNIAYAIGQGKLSLYAFDENTRSDASGFSKDFTVGSSEVDAGSDTTPPVIKLYLNDKTFVNGGLTGSTAQLVASLFDESGINISGYGIGNSIVAVLDENETFILNDYYEANTDDFKSGEIQYTLTGLKPGKHTIILRAWDTFNNPGQSRIDFLVTDGDGIIIEQFMNYPNPVYTSTQFSFTHNQAGSDLEASLLIYDYTGQAVQHHSFMVQESSYQVNLLELALGDDINKKLNPGLYLARLIVRSLADGSKNERVTKLIISN